jgi:hypothetical protein
MRHLIDHCTAECSAGAREQPEWNADRASKRRYARGPTSRRRKRRDRDTLPVTCQSTMAGRCADATSASRAQEDKMGSGIAPRNAQGTR